MDTLQKLFRFLDESPTCCHAAANVLAAMKAAGAVELRESEPWKGPPLRRQPGRLGGHRLPGAGGGVSRLFDGGGPQRLAHL